MKLVPSRRGMAIVIVAATAVSVPGVLWHIHNEHRQQAAHPVQVASSSAIPFEPPIVHPGYGPHMEAFKTEHRRTTGPSGNSNMVFRDEDRKAFKALHPFLIEEPETR